MILILNRRSCEKLRSLVCFSHVISTLTDDWLNEGEGKETLIVYSLILRPDFVSSFDSALFSGLNLRCSIQQSFIRQIMSFVPTSSFFSSGNATTSRRSSASNRSSRPPSASASAVNAEPLREVSGSQLRNLAYTRCQNSRSKISWFQL